MVMMLFNDAEELALEDIAAAMGPSKLRSEP